MEVGRSTLQNGGGYRAPAVGEGGDAMGARRRSAARVAGSRGGRGARREGPAPLRVAVQEDEGKRMETERRAREMGIGLG